MIIGICGPAGSGKDTAADHLVRAHRGVKVALADPLKRYCMDAYGFSEEQLWGPSSARNKPDHRYPRKHTWKVTTDEAGVETSCSCVCCGTSDPETPCFLTPRYALQLLGTEWGRHCFPDTWANKAVKVAQSLLGDHGHDLRYNKAKGIVSLPDHREWEEAERREREKAQYVLISDVRFRNEMNVIRQAGGKVWRIVPVLTKEQQESWRQHSSEAEQTEIPDSDFDAVIVNEKASFEALYASVDASLQGMR